MTQDNVYRDGPITPSPSERANRMLGKFDSATMSEFQHTAAEAEDTAKLYLEAHVTIEPVFHSMLDTATALAKRHGFRVADLLMQKDREATPERSDKDTFMTGHSKSRADIIARVQSLVTDLTSYGIKVWRYKIEDTLVDSRTDDLWGLIV